MDKPINFITTPDTMRFKTRRQQQLVPSFNLGYKICHIPQEVYKKISTHWIFLQNNPQVFQAERNIYMHNTKGNDPAKLFLLESFNTLILDSLQSIHEEWFGGPLVKSICYGVRVYQEGSYLYNHVDLIKTHVISATLCIDSDLEEPWVFYLIDHHGEEKFIYLSPGQMCFYESATIEHGRPIPLQGKYYAAMFVHYRPIWYDEFITATLAGK